MNWRTKLTLSLCPLLLFCFFITKEKAAEPKTATAMTRKVASTSPVIKRPKISDPKKLKALRNKNLSHSLLRNRIPQSLEATLEKDPTVEVTRGYEFIKDVAAISRDKYQSTMGEIVKQDGDMVFFKSSSDAHVPVALSRSTNTLYPLSSILHIKDVSPALRDEILSKGLSQYYYHAGLKFLSVESKNGEIMKTYRDLVRQGYKVELEVLKPTHRPN